MARPFRLARATTLLMALAAGAAVAAADERPNIVFFLVDDLHAQGTHVTGHPFAVTPNIDRLAHEGVMFANAHVTTPLCSPSRASFLTGQFARRHGVVNNRPVEADSTRSPSFPLLLQGAGYRTAFVGKWHQQFRHDPRPGFDTWAAFAGQGTYVGTAQDPIEIRYVAPGVDRLDRYVDGEYNTDLLTGYASSWLDSAAGGDAPFCLLLWYKAVHAPRTPAERHRELYRDQHALPLSPSVLDPVAEGKPEEVAAAVEAWNRRSPSSKQAAVDAAIIADQRVLAAVDESVGQILHQLEELGVLDDTVVVFSSDNGFFFFEFGLGDKRWLYEASTRVPMLLRWPEGTRAGTVSNLPVLSIDLAPTLLDLAGVPIPEGMQGRSFRKLMTEPDAPHPGWRRTWLSEYFDDQPFAVPDATAVSVAGEGRIDKLVHYPGRSTEDEVYDLGDDPSEIHNRLLAIAAEGNQLGDHRQELTRLMSQAAGSDPIHPYLNCFHSRQYGTDPVDSGIGLHLVEPPDGRLEAVEVAGRKARRTLPGSSYMYFDVVDTWAREGSRPEVGVTVTYLDTGLGTLWVQYDAAQGGPYRSSATVALTDSGAWRSHTFELRRVLFAGRQNIGADLRLATTSAAPIVVDRIALDAPPPTEGSITLGEADDYRFLYRVYAPDGATVPASVAGKSCRSAGAGHTFAFDLADEVAFAGSVAQVVIRVEVYDQGRGRLRLEYDGIHGPSNAGGEVQLGGTFRWKEHFFRVEDAWFGNRLEGDADFRLVADGTGVAIHRVTVETGEWVRRGGTRSGP